MVLSQILTFEKKRRVSDFSVVSLLFLVIFTHQSVFCKAEFIFKSRTTKLSLMLLILERIQLRRMQTSSFFKQIVKASASLILLFIVNSACKRDVYYSGSDSALSFSTDTVLFDTIFSTIGSPTLRLKVYNRHDEFVKISKIWLGKGQNSAFKININGASSSVENEEIAPGDSLYIFIQALGSVNGIDTPLLLRDSILFQTNNNIQHIKLLAYNQDVNILNNVTLKTQVWEGSKPYLIYGNVIIDTLETLTIKKGITVYFHWNSNLIVKGSLRAEGEFEHPVTFRDDRMEDTPGEWGGLLFYPGSTGNFLNFVVAKNGTSGICLGKFNTQQGPDIEMNFVIVQNMFYNCLLAINAKVTSANSVFTNGGTYTCGIVGGSYAFYHCTFANYYNTLSASGTIYPALYLSNYYSDATAPDGKSSVALDKAYFVNSIIYGKSADEVELDSLTSATFNYTFDYCLIKGKTLETLHSGRFSNIVWNKDPLFISENDPILMEVDSLSPAKKSGQKDIIQLFPYDLKMKERAKDTIPTIGAYE
jgi:hypothetical protein